MAPPSPASPRRVSDAAAPDGFSRGTFHESPQMSLDVPKCPPVSPNVPSLSPPMSPSVPGLGGPGGGRTPPCVPGGPQPQIKTCRATGGTLG
ncbi:hypothetical protein RLOC_00014548, partial [Lonchura striata]